MGSSNFGTMNFKYALLVALVGLTVLAMVDAKVLAYCKDENPDCPEYIKKNPKECFENFGKDKCKMTCKLCKPDDGCKDENPDCPEYIKKNPKECFENFGKDKCKKTCKRC